MAVAAFVGVVLVYDRGQARVAQNMNKEEDARGRHWTAMREHAKLHLTTALTLVMIFVLLRYICVVALVVTSVQYVTCYMKNSLADAICSVRWIANGRLLSLLCSMA